MIPSEIFRYAGWSAYISASASILGFVFLAAFFSAGQPFGTLNDFFGSILLGLSMMPLAFALERVYMQGNVALTRVVLVTGLVGMTLLVIAGATVILKTFAWINFPEPTPGTGPFGIGLIGPVVIGLWLIFVSYLGLASPALPNLLNWIGITAGAGFGITLIGFILGGQNHPMTWIGGLAAGIAYPIWAIWLGNLLLSFESVPSA